MEALRVWFSKINRLTQLNHNVRDWNSHWGVFHIFRPKMGHFGQWRSVTWASPTGTNRWLTAAPRADLGSTSFMLSFWEASLQDDAGTPTWTRKTTGSWPPGLRRHVQARWIWRSEQCSEPLLVDDRWLYVGDYTTQHLGEYHNPFCFHDFSMSYIIPPGQSQPCGGKKHGSSCWKLPNGPSKSSP